MDLTTNLIAVIIITGLVSAMLSLAVKLMYDGIKAKRSGNNGHNNGNSNNGRNAYEGSQILVDLALLAKDTDFNNQKLTEIKNGIDKLIEHSVITNVHLVELTSTLKTFIGTISPTRRL
jgi:hypothetical protein